MIAISPVGRRLLAISGIAVLCAAIYWLGWAAVVDALQRCSPWAVLVAAVAITVGSVLGAWNVYRIAGLAASMPFHTFLPIFWRSWAAGITLPGQVADMLGTLWQLKGRSGDLSFIAGRLLVDKAITLGLTLALAVFLPGVLGLAGAYITGGLLVCLVLVAAMVMPVVNWSARHPVLARSRWSARVVPVLASASAPLRIVIGNALVTVAKLAITGLAYWTILRSMDPPGPGFVPTTVISQAAGLVAYLPISFNGLGTVEVSAAAMFARIGLSGAVVVSAYLILRTITLAIAWLPLAIMGWPRLERAA